MDRCKAHTSRGPCKRFPIKGGTVCATHGGSAPQVRAAANRRLLADAAVLEFGLSRAKDPERVIAEVGCLAYVRLGDLFDDEGRFLPVKDMPPEVQAAIASSKVKVVNLEAGDGQTDVVTEVKLWDKGKALEFLGKHHGLLTERVEHGGAIVVKWES